MSSQITSLLTAQPSKPALGGREVVRIVVPLVVSAVSITVIQLAYHRDWRFVAAAIVFLAMAAVYPEFQRQGDSPLHIHETVRQLRTMSFALAATIIAWFSVPARNLSWGYVLAAVVFVAGGSFSPPFAVRSVRLASAQKRRMAWSSKRAFDVCVAILALVLLSPIFVLIAMAIVIDSGFPVLFRQRRVGRLGKTFYILKFRSMYVDAPRYERSPRHERDPRITRVGRTLRRLSLDELPQLLNVIRGEMSLVGPRPEMPFLVRRHKARHHERLKAVPGLTGLWQISPARACPIHESIEYDLYYLHHWSFFLDLAILCRTVGAVFRGIGAR